MQNGKTCLDSACVGRTSLPAGRLVSVQQTATFHRPNKHIAHLGVRCHPRHLHGVLFPESQVVLRPPRIPDAKVQVIFEQKRKIENTMKN